MSYAEPCFVVFAVEQLLVAVALLCRCWTTVRVGLVVNAVLGWHTEEVPARGELSIEIVALG